MDAHVKLLILRCVVSLSILSIFTFHKLLLGGKMLKMLKMFILSRLVFLMIIFRSPFLLSQHVRQYGSPSSVAALFGPDAEDFFCLQEATGQAQRN